MTKDEASVLAKDIGEIALDILLQINKCKIQPTLVESFYLALLGRARLILRDASVVLSNNHELQLTSAYILFRVLLDDFIRILSVYSSDNSEEEIIKIQADALKHKFKVFQENADLNNEYFNGQHSTLSTQTMFDDAKQEILNNPHFDKHFSNKNQFKFKKLTDIANVFKQLMKDSEYKDASAHSYVLYKELTRHVHHAHLSYPFESEERQRQCEINILEEVLFYCYKMIQIHFSFFSKSYEITWKDTKVTEYYKTRTIFIKQQGSG